MPNRDGTGPEGRGPRTGRGLGNCAPRKDEQLTSRPQGRGLRGLGRRGLRRRRE